MMISVWWILPAFFVGMCVGVFFLALCNGNKGDDK